jgi:hypothetical protein
VEAAGAVFRVNIARVVKGWRFRSIGKVALLTVNPTACQDKENEEN